MSKLVSKLDQLEESVFGATHISELILGFS